MEHTRYSLGPHIFTIIGIFVSGSPSLLVLLVWSLWVWDASGATAPPTYPLFYPHYSDSACSASIAAVRLTLRCCFF